MRRRRVSSWLVIPLALALCWAAGVWSSRAPSCQRLRDTLQTRMVPAALLNRGSLGDMMRRMRLVRPALNDGKAFPASRYPKASLMASLFQKKRMVGPVLYAPNEEWLQELATRREPPMPDVPPELFRPGWPLLAINIDPEDLTGLKWGIFTYFLGHGREWERPAAMAYYVDGRPVFATRAGLRLHGGRSREPLQVHSVRLHFREEYGAAEFKRGVLFGPESEPIRRLVVKADWPHHYPYVGLLAYDMAERIGGIVPHTQPVLFVLNGQLQTNLYFLAEHVGRAAWANRVGHRDFLMYVMKGVRESESFQAYAEFHRWALRTPEPLDLAEVEKRVDLDNLSAYVLAIAYGGTTDGFQGAALFDPREAHPRWKYITWDLDHSFWDVYRDRSEREPWQKEAWEQAYKSKGDPNYNLWRNRADARSILFARLMNHSPVYRARFLRYTIDMLNHRLTEPFLFERIARYEELARSFGYTDFAFAADYREFVRRRPAVLREGLQRLFNPGPVRRVEVRVPAGTPLRIDGFEETGPYVGFYFEGQTVEIAAADGIAGWTVNGAPAGPDAGLSRAVDGDWLVEPVPVR